MAAAPPPGLPGSKVATAIPTRFAAPVATVPPTVALAREAFGPVQGTVVFGWVFAAHQIGAAVAAAVAGIIRTSLGSYTVAWWGAGMLCIGAATVSLGITGRTSAPAEPTRDAPVVPVPAVG